MFGALAEFERSLMRERTQAGLAAARRIGRTGGRPPKLTEDNLEAARALLADPDIGVTQIAHRLGVSPATLYRYLPAARAANSSESLEGCAIFPGASLKSPSKQLTPARPRASGQ
jgi:DNA invertase Pin-like site-specific DNA recombinase